MTADLRCRTLLFDFDGVLVNSMSIKGDAFAGLFQSEPADMRRKIVAHHYAHGGMPRTEKIEHYHTQFLGRSISDDELNRLCRRFADLVKDAVIAAPAIAGVRQFLQHWHQRLDCHVVSAAPEAELRQIIDGRAWTRYFRTVSGAPRRKAEAIEKVLSANRLAPREALFFGDAREDFKAAQITGVHFAAVAPCADSPLADCREATMRIADFNDPTLHGWMTESHKMWQP